jgi:hypothetical protein
LREEFSLKGPFLSKNHVNDWRGNLLEKVANLCVGGGKREVKSWRGHYFNTKSSEKSLVTILSVNFTGSMETLMQIVSDHFSGKILKKCFVTI